MSEVKERPEAPTRAELLDSLRTTGKDVLTQLRDIPPEEFEQGRYENGWNAREILAHIASIEWTYPKLIEIAQNPPAEGPEEDQRSPKVGFAHQIQTPSRPARGGIDSYNERHVAKREGVPVAELLREFERNREATIQAVEEAGEDLLASEVRTAGGFVGPLTQVLQWVAVDHVKVHLRDILPADPN